MSYSFDGKIVNQSPKYRFNSGNPQPTCAKCNTLVPSPEKKHHTLKLNQSYLIFNYLGTPHFIYETKSGFAVIYCSKYCRNKHNHRFVK